MAVRDSAAVAGQMLDARGHPGGQGALHIGGGEDGGQVGPRAECTAGEQGVLGFGQHVGAGAVKDMYAECACLTAGDEAGPAGMVRLIGGADGLLPGQLGAISEAVRRTLFKVSPEGGWDSAALDGGMLQQRGGRADGGESAAVDVYMANTVATNIGETAVALLVDIGLGPDGERQSLSDFMINAHAGD